MKWEIYGTDMTLRVIAEKTENIHSHTFVPKKKKIPVMITYNKDDKKFYIETKETVEVVRDYPVENFYYNGFFVSSKPGRAPYTAAFDHWTDDPGIAACLCSDGLERLIPSCCLIGSKPKHFPTQENASQTFGNSSTS